MSALALPTVEQSAAALALRCPKCLRQPKENCTAIEGRPGSLMAIPHPERVAAAAPTRRDDNTWTCCGGYGEHFAHCLWATWEKREL